MDTVNNSKVAYLPENAERTKQLKEKYGDENVMVVDRNLIPESLNKGEFTYAEERVLGFIADIAHFVPRYIAEYNPMYRQPIPYIVLKVNGKYFATRRLSGSGEARLHNLISLGVGGHINPQDIFNGFGDTVFENALWRELNEEINFPKCTFDVEFVGVINDTSNSVSQDHLGLLFICNMTIEEGDDKVSVKETDNLEGITLTLEEIGDSYKDLESWSKIVYNEVLSKWGVK